MRGGCAHTACGLHRVSVFAHGDGRECVLVAKAAGDLVPGIAEAPKDLIVLGWCRGANTWIATPPLRVRGAFPVLRAAVIGPSLFVFWGYRDSPSAHGEASGIGYASVGAGDWSQARTLFRATTSGTFLWWRSVALSDVIRTPMRKSLLAVPLPGGRHTSRVLRASGDSAGQWMTQLLTVPGIAYTAVAASPQGVVVGYVGAASGGGTDGNSVQAVISTGGGEQWGPPALLHRAGRSAPVHELDLVGRTDGRVVALWRREDAGRPWSIWFTETDVSGRWRTARQLMLGDHAQRPGRLTVAVDSGDRIGLLLSQREGEEDNSYSVYDDLARRPRVQVKWSQGRGASQLVRTARGELAVLTATRIDAGGRAAGVTSLTMMTLSW